MNISTFKIEQKNTNNDVDYCNTSYIWERLNIRKRIKNDKGAELNESIW